MFWRIEFSRRRFVLPSFLVPSSVDRLGRMEDDLLGGYLGDSNPRYAFLGK